MCQERQVCPCLLQRMHIWIAALNKLHNIPVSHKTSVSWQRGVMLLPFWEGECIIALIDNEGEWLSKSSSAISIIILLLLLIKFIYLKMKSADWSTKAYRLAVPGVWYKILIFHHLQNSSENKTVQMQFLSISWGHVSLFLSLCKDPARCTVLPRTLLDKLLVSEVFVWHL